MNKQALHEQSLSEQIENMLVERNLRGMKNLQTQLSAGYCLRAAQVMRDIKGTVLIGTGFPVEDTFETDGPVGALILYRALEFLGATPVLVCGTQMATAFQHDYRTCMISVGNKDIGLLEAKRALAHFQPQAIISIECPGLAENGCYHNMRAEDISARAACFDFFMDEANCPTIAIGDGGNEIGMGNVKAFLAELDIIPAVTECDELIISDVSNWGVYGILAFLSIWSNHDLLNETSPEKILKYISNLGSVDGVTRKNELTEDSLPVAEGIALIKRIRTLIGY
ncbi:glutamate cyclase domain-containing protein [Candidatus Colwellia aromaticivorans]|uniref:glutamate cyclase domain-containing protein n=1 Tax=Candidatus Colwellia aromaticivorans TaxID=2267621 RepID=UPI000DF157C6|nr:glutamate cyclase domain-containing protein [Candidatus Colwellia aromaticivorans]